MKAGVKVDIQGRVNLLTSHKCQEAALQWFEISCAEKRLCLCFLGVTISVTT